MSAVLSSPAAEPSSAAEHFRSRLAFETDVSDVHCDLESQVGHLIVVDSRSEQSWQQGHIPQAIHLPTAEIGSRARDLLDLNCTVVTYCWGPACNGATRAALAFAEAGYRVKEMLGGFEYWVRQGFPVENADGVSRRPADPLTAVPDAVVCGC